jgi:hypothetical protein
MVTARVSLRPQWFFCVPPILVMKCGETGPTFLNGHPSHLKVYPFADVIGLETLAIIQDKLQCRQRHIKRKLATRKRSTKTADMNLDYVKWGKMSTIFTS